jgi:prepilin-type processing-associated H-X9-DG protein
MKNLANVGWTLTELLTVIAVIGLLLALTIPAVQRARESANAVACRNHLRQIGLGFESHHDSSGHFPVSGYFPPKYRTPGDPIPIGRYVWTARGSWLFQLLPYVGEEAVYRQCHAKDADEADRNVIAHPIAIYSCPSRARTRVFDLTEPISESTRAQGIRRATSDYAANNGTRSHPGIFQGSNQAWIKHVRIGHSAFHDGLSTTLFVGERHLDKNYYLAPNEFVQSSYAIGSENAFVADIGFSPKPNPPKSDHVPFTKRWTAQAGSAHPTSMNAVFGDGSVRSIAYSVDPYVWLAMCGRDDGIAWTIPE